MAAVGGDEFDESFSLPGTESQAALDSLSRTFPQASGTTAQVVVVAPAGANVRDPEIRAAIEQAPSGFAEIDQVEQALSPSPRASKVASVRLPTTTAGHPPPDLSELQRALAP